MNKYNKSIIYKIEHVSNPDLCYIGGTTNFNARKAQHKSRTLNPNDKEHNGYKYKMIRDNGGWDKFRMIPLKNVNVNSKRDLEMEEEQFRELYKAKLNAYKAYSETSHKPSEEAKLLSQINHDLKLQKYRMEHAEEIQKYKNDKAFLNVIKKKKYTLEDYKELPITFSETNMVSTINLDCLKINESENGHNGFVELENSRIVDLEKESTPIPVVKKRGRPKKINV